MQTLVASVVPVFIIVGLGYIARKTNLIKAQWVNALIGYVYVVALPALIIYSIMTLEFTSGDVPKALFWSTAVLVISSVLCLLFMRIVKIRNNDRAVFFLAATVGNSLYLGIPLTTNALGLTSGTADYALIVLIGVVYLVGGIFIALVVNEFLFVGNKSVGHIAKRLAKNPLIIAIGLGIILSLVSLPETLNTAVTKPLSMLAASASPVALFVLGSYLYGHSLKGQKFALSTAVAWKLIVVPVIAWLLLGVSNIQNPSYAATILYAGMPTAVTALMIAKAYGFNTGFVAAVILLSTIASIVTESGLILLLGL